MTEWAHIGLGLGVMLLVLGLALRSKGGSVRHNSGVVNYGNVGRDINVANHNSTPPSGDGLLTVLANICTVLGLPLAAASLYFTIYPLAAAPAP